MLVKLLLKWEWEKSWKKSVQSLDLIILSLRINLRKTAVCAIIFLK